MSVSHLYDLKGTTKEFLAYLMFYTFTHEDKNNTITDLVDKRNEYDRKLSICKNLRVGINSNTSENEYHITCLETYISDINIKLQKVETDIEELLHKLLLAVIESNINKVIRKLNTTHYKILQEFCKEYKLDHKVFHNTLVTMSGFKAIVDDINSVMTPNSYIIFSLNKVQGSYLLQEVGDFRIMQWEEEHVRKGKYYKDILK